MKIVERKYDMTDHRDDIEYLDKFVHYFHSKAKRNVTEGKITWIVMVKEKGSVFVHAEEKIAATFDWETGELGIRKV